MFSIGVSLAFHFAVCLFLPPAPVGAKSIELTLDNFDRAVSGQPWMFIKFFAPWCGHCKSMAHDWAALGNLAEIDLEPEMKVAEVDCTKQKELCSQHQVKAYPTISLFQMGKKVHEYEYERTLYRMKTFLLEKLGRLAEPGDNGIFELTTKSWDVFHKEQNSFIVVQFLSPDCSNCQRVEPIYEDLVTDFELNEGEDIVFASFNCNKDPESGKFCTRRGISQLPLFRIYENGRVQDQLYDASVDHTQLMNFVWNTVDPSRIEDEVELASLLSRITLNNPTTATQPNQDGDEDDDEEEEEEDEDEYEDYSEDDDEYEDDYEQDEGNENDDEREDYDDEYEDKEVFAILDDAFKNDDEKIEHEYSSNSKKSLLKEEL